MKVIKVGGNDLAQPGFLGELAAVIAMLNDPCIVVHGGGRVVTELMGRLGVETHFVAGQRVTDAETLNVVEMVLSGQVNNRITEALIMAGIDAWGMSGVDRSLLRVEPVHSLGLVGRVVDVRGQVLRDLCQQGVVPVVSPISIGPGGRYNVNADHAAGAIAAAVSASHLTFLTNVPGVMIEGSTQPTLTAEHVRMLINEAVISGGMVPKVTAGLDALWEGVGHVVITDLPGLRHGRGTVIVH